jgi:hypothetical protein
VRSKRIGLNRGTAARAMEIEWRLMVSRYSRASRRARLCGAYSHNGMRAGWRCAGAGTRRVRRALPIGSAARFSGGLVAASGPSEALGRQRAS